MADITEPGDYYLTDDKTALWFRLPIVAAERSTRSLRRLTSPPWTFRECDDGSVEVRASIGAYGDRIEDGHIWHGFLDEGHVWREC